MMNGKVRAFNGDMGMAMSVFKDMVGKVRFVFADPPYKITCYQTFHAKCSYRIYNC